MPTLKIWETVRADDALPIIRLDERLTYKTVSFTGTAGQSTALDGDTSIISVMADANCAIAVGADPTATADSFPLVANVRQDFSIQPGQKVSVITR